MHQVRSDDGIFSTRSNVCRSMEHTRYEYLYAIVERRKNQKSHPAGSSVIVHILYSVTVLRNIGHPLLQAHTSHHDSFSTTPKASRRLAAAAVSEYRGHRPRLSYSSSILEYPNDNINTQEILPRWYSTDTTTTTSSSSASSSTFRNVIKIASAVPFSSLCQAFSITGRTSVHRKKPINGGRIQDFVLVLFVLVYVVGQTNLGDPRLGGPTGICRHWQGLSCSRGRKCQFGTRSIGRSHDRLSLYRVVVCHLVCDGYLPRNQYHG